MPKAHSRKGDFQKSLDQVGGFVANGRFGFGTQLFWRRSGVSSLRLAASHKLEVVIETVFAAEKVECGVVAVGTTLESCAAEAAILGRTTTTSPCIGVIEEVEIQWRA
ncbi:hypothetical protein HPB50_021165 [Hyalomma asiaticum]|uniref:Uncharacterized protein n=1 Tax=Hyalomma asiaticum TaxID=266040 RepID=A0ACB7S8B1_HYAAI|nr:hypothetical protein HPB50_021165 [Hyalomma asiaticum]